MTDLEKQELYTQVNELLDIFSEFSPITGPNNYNEVYFKKNVGVVTMNLHYNIGTALQAYALQNVINSFGYGCDIIT